MANLFRVITSTRDLIDGVLATAETATTAVGNVVTVVSSTLTSPLVRLSAFAWGLRRAVAKAAEEDEGTAGRRRRGRRARARGGQPQRSQVAMSCQICSGRRGWRHCGLCLTRRYECCDQVR